MSGCVFAIITMLFDYRGLSDSIFGLTVVYAGLVMYDAQVYAFFPFYILVNVSLHIIISNLIG